MEKTTHFALFLVAISTALFIFGFSDRENQRSMVPLPPELHKLPTIKAEPWVLVDDDPNILLEGPAFDREGNLFVTSIFDSRLFKITPTKHVTSIQLPDGLLPDGIAIHKDGRLFIACLSGRVVTVNPDDGTILTDLPKFNGKPASANDLVFDNENGDLYVTDFTGSVAEPTGGVYRFSDNYGKVDPVIQNLASANGIGIAPPGNLTGGNVLWVSETCRNEILHIELLADGSINPIAGVTIPCRFGGGPGGSDSLRIDVEGNVYQCMIFQGRAEILNNRGVPIANVLIPGREKGKHLVTSNLAFKPGTDEVYIMAGGEGGAWIYKFRGLTQGLRLYSHQ